MVSHMDYLQTLWMIFHIKPPVSASRNSPRLTAEGRMGMMGMVEARGPWLICFTNMGYPVITYGFYYVYYYLIC